MWNLFKINNKAPERRIWTNKCRLVGENYDDHNMILVIMIMIMIIMIYYRLINLTSGQQVLSKFNNK